MKPAWKQMLQDCERSRDQQLAGGIQKTASRVGVCTERRHTETGAVTDYELNGLD
jgi:hypothetical protein